MGRGLSYLNSTNSYPPAFAAAIFFLACAAAEAQPSRVVDVPTRPGVTQRFLYVAADKPKAAAVLFAGGQGDLQISPHGSFGRKGNFVVRSRALFAENGIAVAVVDAPSDRSSLAGFRQTREHVEDVRAVIAWLRKEVGVPVWLVGTSRGTQSAGYVATQLARGEGGADGVVLTSTVMAQSRNMRETTVPDMALQRVAVPVLVVHHKQDACRVCPFADVPRLMSKLTAAPRKELIAVEGGESEGDPCEAFAYHGYNGIEREVVAKIAGWIAQP
jgi:alpha/beta superfamily hydrolase